MGFILIGIGILIVVGGMYVLLTLFRPDSKSPKERREQIHAEKISADMNRFAAQKEQTASAARTALSEQLNLESDSYLHKEIKDAEMEVAFSQHRTTILETEARGELIKKAFTKGWDIDTYLELEKASELNRLELEKEWKSAEQSLKGGFIVQMESQQKLYLMTEYIGGLYEKAKLLLEQGKDREHQLIEQHIAFMEKDFHAKQRLLQTANGENAEGNDPDS